MTEYCLQAVKGDRSYHVVITAQGSATHWQVCQLAACLYTVWSTLSVGQDYCCTSEEAHPYKNKCQLKRIFQGHSEPACC